MLELACLVAIDGLGAPEERLQHITTELQRPISWFDVWLVVGFLIIAPLVAWFCFRRFGSNEPREVSAKPKALFQELCDGHALLKEERDLLEVLARHGKLEPTAKIFLEPDLFADPGLAPAQQKLAVLLREKLFGDLAARASSPSGGSFA